MKALSVLGGVVLAAMAVACGASAGDESASSTSGAMTVHGSVSSRLSLDNARAVAIGSDGRTFWAYLDQDREFTLELPVGQSYRVIVANQRPGGGQQTVGHLVLAGGSGRTEWLGANSAIDVDLGTLRVAGGSSTKIACDCSGDDEADPKSAKHDDDYPSKEGKGSSTGKDTGTKNADDSADDSADDGDKGGVKDPDDCDVCTDPGSDSELEPTKKPGSACDDKGKNDLGDKSDPKKYGDKKSCSKGSEDKSATGGKDTGTKGSDATDKSAGEKDASGAKGPADASGKSEGSKCNASSECKDTCACVASTCSTKKK